MTRDQVEVVLIAAGWTAAVGVLGLAASRGIARWSFRWLLALVAAVAVGGVVAGVIGTADAMFLSAHDRGVALDRKSTRLNSSHVSESRMPSSA